MTTQISNLKLGGRLGYAIARQMLTLGEWGRNGRKSQQKAPFSAFKAPRFQL